MNLQTDSSRTDPRGVVLVLDSGRYLAEARAAGRRAALATCGACGRTWDDAIITGVTPTPAARCPFEDLHRPDVLTGWLHHGRGTQGPFRTERVTVKHECADRYLARFEGKWRRVQCAVKAGPFIRYRGERIALQIEGDPL